MKGISFFPEVTSGIKATGIKPLAFWLEDNHSTHSAIATGNPIVK